MSPMGREGHSVSRRWHRAFACIELAGVILAAAAYFTWYAEDLLWIGSDSIRQASAFAADEAVHARLIQEALRDSTMDIGFYSYGHLYFNLALLPLYISGDASEISEQKIILALRAVPLAFAVGTIVATFLLARFSLGSALAWMVVAFLCVMPLVLLKWSMISHPDMPQLFFIVLGLYACSRYAAGRHWRVLVWAAVAAGLAFSSKYAGLFLLGLVWLIVVARAYVDDAEDGFRLSRARCRMLWHASGLVVGTLLCLAAILSTPGYPVGYYGAAVILVGGAPNQSEFETWFAVARIAVGIAGAVLIWWAARSWCRRPPATSGEASRWNKAAGKIGLTLAVFLVSFAVTSPYSLAGARFLRGMVLAAQKSRLGHHLVADDSGWRWLTLLATPGFFEWTILTLAAIGGVLVIAQLSWRGWKEGFRPESVPALWVFLYAGWLVVHAGYQPSTSYYLLPIVPALLILSAYPLKRLGSLVTLRWGSRAGSFVLGIAVCSILIWELPSSVSAAAAYRAEIRSREDPSFLVGEWLEENCAPSAVILYDHYSYVPDSFALAVPTAEFGGTARDLDEHDPDLVVVSQEMSSRFLDPADAKDYVRGPESYLLKYKYYEALRSGETGYSQIRDFGGVEVYAKRSRPGETGPATP